MHIPAIPVSELAISGYPPKDLLLREGFAKSCDDAVDRLARACDVGGVIAAREAATMRSRYRSANRQHTAAPRRWRDRLNIFRGLHNLT